jgi:hypothetical protein
VHPPPWQADTHSKASLHRDFFTPSFQAFDYATTQARDGRFSESQSVGVVSYRRFTLPVSQFRCSLIKWKRPAIIAGCRGAAHAETKQNPLPGEDHSQSKRLRSNSWAKCRDKKGSAPSRRRRMSLDIPFYRTLPVSRLAGEVKDNRQT